MRWRPSQTAPGVLGICDPVLEPPMDPLLQDPFTPLRWRDALRRILALLEWGPGAAAPAWDPEPQEIEMLRLAGFGPLLSDALAGHPAFPALFAEEVLNRRRVEAHRRALSALLERLEGNISPPVLFKGMVACDELYDKPSLRVFTDIDILVPVRDLAAWERAILSLGGWCTDHLVFPRRRFSARHYFQHPFSLPTGDPALRVDLDLHLSFGPLQRYPVTYARAAPHCRASDRGPYLVLNPYQWICALAIHQVRTLFVWSYQDYVDLFQILRRTVIRDELLIEAARGFGALKASSILFRHLRMVLPEGSAVKVPEFDAFLPPRHQEFEGQLRLPVASRAVGDPSFVRNALRTARLTDSALGLLRYLLVYGAKRGMDLVVRG